MEMRIQVPLPSGLMRCHAGARACIVKGTQTIQQLFTMPGGSANLDVSHRITALQGAEAEGGLDPTTLTVPLHVRSFTDTIRGGPAGPGASR